MMAGLLELLIDSYKRGSGLLAPNQEDVKLRANMSGLIADLTPGIGDAKSAYEGVQAARQGDMLGAGLGALGALPLIPSFAGIVRNPTLEKAAKSHFGRTANPQETGFLLDDATRLDLSGRHYASGYSKQGDKYLPNPGQPDYLRNSRATDHRELGELVDGGGWNGLSDFMNQTGAVRYMPNTGISVVDTNMPSQSQIESAVKDFRRSGETLYVDVDRLDGSSRMSEEFTRPTVESVMNFIKKNMKPEAFK